MSNCREAAEAVATSAAALAALIKAAEERADLPDADLLRELADACLDGMAEVARLEARSAAVKVRLAAEYAEVSRALAPPAASPQERTAQEMAVVAEVACVLTVSERSAGALLSDAQVLTTALPLTLEALEAGTISWQHARIMVDETASLDPVGAAGLEAHFLDPDAPDPARGCRAGDLVPARFRVKARTWRERHHPVSIEKRHTKCAADRRVEFVPDRDGMAWLNAYLPADTAAGIFERTTAAARALQGPDEARTLTQLRADIAATWLLTAGLDDGGTGGGRAGAGTSGGIAGPGAARPATASRDRHERGNVSGAGGGTGLVRAGVRAGVCRRRGRRCWSPSRCCRCWASPTNRPCWTGTGRSRRRWRAGWSPTAPIPSTGS